jgi:23S rRNA (uracil1939-C5)-methyltransferase
LKINPRAALLDPPRAGLHPAALQSLIAAKPEQIAYVSCDPATLARDLQKLAVSGYKLESVTPFDLFRRPTTLRRSY